MLLDPPTRWIESWEDLIASSSVWEDLIASSSVLTVFENEHHAKPPPPPAAAAAASASKMVGVLTSSSGGGGRGLPSIYACGLQTTGFPGWVTEFRVRWWGEGAAIHIRVRSSVLDDGVSGLDDRVQGWVAEFRVQAGTLSVGRRGSELSNRVQCGEAEFMVRIAPTTIACGLHGFVIIYGDIRQGRGTLERHGIGSCVRWLQPK
jgi:hypothetical protein